MSARIATLFGVLLAANAWAAEPVAEVFILDGNATVGERPLVPGDAIESGSTVRTGHDSRVALFSSEIYVQLDPESALRFERNAQNRVELSLESGRARIVDTRGGGAPAAVGAGGALARVQGGDQEIYILSEKTGRYAMFCDWTRPLVVSKDKHEVGADPGDCVLVKPREVPYAARGHDHQIPLLPGPDDGPADAVMSRFAPDVAAGPFHGFPGPAEAPDRERDPCDLPGTGCAAGLVIVEPAPDVDGCPPGLVCDGE